MTSFIFNLILIFLLGSEALAGTLVFSRDVDNIQNLTLMKCSEETRHANPYQVWLDYNETISSGAQYLLNIAKFSQSSPIDQMPWSHVISTFEIPNPQEPTHINLDNGDLSVLYWQREPWQGSKRPKWQGKGTLFFNGSLIKLSCTLSPLNNCVPILTGCGGEIENCQCEN